MAQLKTYSNTKVCQVVIVQMIRTTEGFTLQLVENVEHKGWQDWLDKVDEEGKTVEELQSTIQKQFTKGDHPKIMLKKLWEYKQGQKEMKDFLLEFENLSVLTKISKEHGLEILQQNICWGLMEKMILQYGPPADYDNLQDLLIIVGVAEQYLSIIKHTHPSKHVCHPNQTPLFTILYHKGYWWM